MKKLLALLLCFCLLLTLFAGCSGKTEESTTAPTEPSETTGACPLEDGIYVADFDSDSSMFHVNETCNGGGTLTVENGQMTIHLVMPSKNIVNLFPGTAEDAQKEGAALLEPSVDTVTYSDGMTEEVYAFDLPVPVLDEEFDCALVGTKGKWYDHKVKVSNPVVQRVVTAEVTMTGGTGRASIESPAVLRQIGEEYWATIVWSSPNYEYMIVDGEQYDPIQTTGNSTFVIPVVLDQDIPVTALTVAMSEPHLIDYTLHFDSATIQ